MTIVSMTDRFVANAKTSGGKRTDYFDAKTRGLNLRIGAGGSKSWSFNFTDPHSRKRARVALGTYPATSLAEARARAVMARGLAEEGSDPRRVFADERQGGLTVTALIESYLAKHVRPNLRTADKVERRLRRNVLPTIGHLIAPELHKRDLNRVLDPILERGGAVMAARCFEDMRAAFRWAVARGDLDHSPMEGMRKPVGNAPRERVLSDEEIATLWPGLPVALARSKSCQRVLKLCLVTGQRVGEVAGMDRAELDLEARTWTLPGSRTKNGQAHLVPLSPLAVDIIREALVDVGNSPFVFPCNGQSLDPLAVARTVGRANQTGRFGIDHFTAHDLRRTVLTNFARLGVAPIVAGAVANHTTVTKATITLAVYQKYTYEAEKRAALELWAERLGEMIHVPA